MKNLSSFIILFAVSAILFCGCSNNGKYVSENPAEITVTTGSAEISVTGAILRGAVFGDTKAVTEAGFDYGTDENLDNHAAGSIKDAALSAHITGLKPATTYYYRAYAAAGKKRQEGQVRTFRTSSDPDKLAGKKWLELPLYQADGEHIAKAYFSTMKDGSSGRNYSMFYDTEKLLALWVAFPMNKETHLGSVSRPKPDPWDYDRSGDIPIGFQPEITDGTYGNYSVDKYDRGHQIASADRNGSPDAMKQTFMVTNVTPQFNNLNQQIWSGLEDGIRRVAESTSVGRDTLYVITGPILDPAAPKTVKDRAGKDCAVPNGYFKVVLWSKYGVSDGRRSYDSVGFMFENRAYSEGKNGYPQFAVSVSEIERQTGLTFFNNLGLSPAEMTALKAASSWSEFQNRATSAVTPD